LKGKCFIEGIEFTWRSLLEFSFTRCFDTWKNVESWFGAIWNKVRMAKDTTDIAVIPSTATFISYKWEDLSQRFGSWLAWKCRSSAMPIWFLRLDTINLLPCLVVWMCKSDQLEMDEGKFVFRILEFCSN